MKNQKTDRGKLRKDIGGNGLRSTRRSRLKKLHNAKERNSGIRKKASLPLGTHTREVESHKKRAFYCTMTTLLPLRPKTSGEYISSALAGGTTKRPGVVARAM